MSINSYLRPSSTKKTFDDGKGVGTVTLRDYRHAARIFTDDNFRLSPKYGFLFYVEFDFNPLITEISNTAAQELGMIVKSVTLPKFTIDTKTHNAYNRKNIVQNSIKYDPVNIIFHDDQADNVRNFWYDYYSFFYRDPDYADATYSAPHKYQSRPSFDWGYSPRPTVGYNNANGVQPYQYIQAIRIYSLYQKNFSEYTLINPIITNFKHGDHANGENTSLLQHEMQIQFETVKYQTGYTTANTVGGFVDLHYDNTSSPIAPKDGTDLVDNGMGGFAHATDTITDLANNQTAINPFLRVDAALSTASFNSASIFATSFGQATTLSAATAGTNNGGYSLPSLGSLTQGVTNQAMVQQQLQAAGIGLVNRTAGTLVNGVTGGIAAGLGANGKTIIGLAATAIANPSAALATVENMAIQYATGVISNAVNSIVTPFATGLSQDIASGIGKYITTPISGAFGDAVQYVGSIPTAITYGTTPGSDQTLMLQQQDF